MMTVVEREGGERGREEREREEEREGQKKVGVGRKEGDLCVKVIGRRGLKRYGEEEGEENVTVHGQMCDWFAQ